VNNKIGTGNLSIASGRWTPQRRI